MIKIKQLYKRKTGAIHTYKSEILVTSVKLFSDSANARDATMLDKIINKRAQEDWEFFCHSYMPNSASTRSAILLTFRKYNVSTIGYPGYYISRFTLIG